MEGICTDLGLLLLTWKSLYSYRCCVCSTKQLVQPVLSLLSTMFCWIRNTFSFDVAINRLVQTIQADTSRLCLFVLLHAASFLVHRLSCASVASTIRHVTQYVQLVPRSLTGTSIHKYGSRTRKCPETQKIYKSLLLPLTGLSVVSTSCS